MPSIKTTVGNMKYLSFDDVLHFPTITTIEDELGQVEKNEDFNRMAFCSKSSVNRAEFLAAGQLDLKPQIQLIVDSEEYDGETKLKYVNTVYSIYRSFERSDGSTELYCEVKAGG